MTERTTFWVEVILSKVDVEIKCANYNENAFSLQRGICHVEFEQIACFHVTVLERMIKRHALKHTECLPTFTLNYLLQKHNVVDE